MESLRAAIDHAADVDRAGPLLLGPGPRRWRFVAAKQCDVFLHAKIVDT
jgi:hypothetical protein